MPTPTAVPTATPQPLHVYVNGAVAAPDVYVLPPDSRVQQAIEAAGGFSDEANAALVNLAQPLADGVQIYVPEKEESSLQPVQVIIEPKSQQREISAGIGGLLININKAGPDELDQLPGIGPAIAQKIIAYRAANGPFSAIEDIQDVSGIGEAKFAQIRDLITIGG